MKKIKTIIVSLAISASLQNIALGADGDYSGYFDLMKIKKYQKTSQAKPFVLKEVKPLTVQAIIISGEEEKKTCVIKDKLLTIGDTIDNFTIVEIEKNKVHITDQNENIQILILY